MLFFLETGTFYLCLKSYDYTSYFLKVYFANQIERYQKYNFILAGMNLNGYLPAKKVIKYKTVEFTENADIKYEMHVNSGIMELYGIVCEKLSECLIKGDNIGDYGKKISIN